MLGLVPWATRHQQKPTPPLYPGPPVATPLALRMLFSMLYVSSTYAVVYTLHVFCTRLRNVIYVGCALRIRVLQYAVCFAYDIRTL